MVIQFILIVVAMARLLVAFLIRGITTTMNMTPIDWGNAIKSENCLFNCGMILEEEFDAKICYSALFGLSNCVG